MLIYLCCVDVTSLFATTKYRMSKNNKKEKEIKIVNAEEENLHIFPTT